MVCWFCLGRPHFEHAASYHNINQLSVNPDSCRMGGRPSKFKRLWLFDLSKAGHDAPTGNVSKLQRCEPIRQASTESRVCSKAKSRPAHRNGWNAEQREVLTRIGLTCRRALAGAVGARTGTPLDRKVSGGRVEASAVAGIRLRCARLRQSLALIDRLAVDQRDQHLAGRNLGRRNTW